MKNKTRLWVSVLLMLSLGLFAVVVVTAQEDGGEATEEAPAEATEEMAAATEEAVETTEEATAEEATVEVTEEATAEEATVEVTEEATAEATEMAEVTEEATAEATEEAEVTPVAVPTSAVADEYVIQPGDTLFAIANRFNVSVDDLAEANDIVNPSRIFWGLTLQIPTVGDDDDAGTGGPVATEEATATPEADDDDDDNNATLETYTVRTGDNLYRISLRYDTTIARLVELNPAITNENIIYVGQEILVPASS